MTGFPSKRPLGAVHNLIIHYVVELGIVPKLLKSGEVKEIVLEGSKDVSDACVGSAIKALEECKSPPDVEIVKRVFDKSIRQSSRFDDLRNLESLILGTTKKEDDKDKQMNSKEASTFTDIFKRSQGRGR